MRRWLAPAARRAIQSGTTIDSNRLTSLRINYTHHEVRSYGICIANFTLGTAGSIFFLSARSCLPRVVPKLHRWKRWLTQFMPHPGLIATLCFAPVMVILFIIGMLIGGTIWLLLMKRFVHQDILATFFLGGPRVPLFSNLCSKIFAWSYGQNRPKTEV